MSSGFMAFTSTLRHCSPKNSVRARLPFPRLWPGTSKGTMRALRITNLATAAGDPQQNSSVIVFWDVASGRELRRLRISAGQIIELTFSPDGGKLLKNFVRHVCGLPGDWTMAEFRKTKFTAEANTGEGIKLPLGLRSYILYVIPVVMMVIFVFGYIEKFFLN